MERILCAWSPSWAIDNWRRRNPCAEPAEAPPAPFALIETVRGVRRLAAVSREAAALGLSVGQKATDAAALAPELVTAEAEPEADAAALTALVDWCVRFSPAVAPDPPDGLFLDIEGVAHLWGGEAALMDDLLARLAANGLGFRAAVAGTPGAAWAVCRFGRDRTIVPDGGAARALAPLAPAALRLAPQDAAQLERLGLRRIGQVADLPRAPLARRYGQALVRRLDQALGRAEEALAFRRPPTPWFARLAFAEPISAPEDLARVAQDICGQLCAKLAEAGRGARRFELAWHRVDGRAPAVRVGLSKAACDPVRLARLFLPKLETVDPGFGIEVATLAAEGVEPLVARQARLDAAAEAGEDGLAPLIDRLANRLGEDRVWRARPVESHVPERAVARTAPLAPPTEAAPWRPEQPRPHRLFRRPEPLEGVIAPIPDDPPLQFRWRGRVVRVRRAEGPERIAEEWWRRPVDEVSPGHVRDYYRVEDAGGERFWIFRAGLYEAGTAPKWWLHGLFG